MKKKLLSVLFCILVFALALTGCGKDSTLKNAKLSGNYSTADLNKMASTLKDFSGGDFDYKTENEKSYDNWLSAMTPALKKKMQPTVKGRIDADKTSQLVETMNKVEITKVTSKTVNKKKYALADFNVYQNVKHSTDKTKIGKKFKIKGNAYLLKSGSEYKVDGFTYEQGKATK